MSQYIFDPVMLFGLVMLVMLDKKTQIIQVSVVTTNVGAFFVKKSVLNIAFLCFTMFQILLLNIKLILNI
jgi:hypothetical protein